MAYNARKKTRTNVRRIYSVLGNNYAATARYLNQNTRSNPITANQVKKVIAGQGTRLTSAQVRRMNRQTSTTASSRNTRGLTNEKSFNIKLAKKNAAIAKRIAVKRAKYQLLYDRAESVGDVTGMQDALDELSRLDDLNRDVQLAVKNARTADDYRGISDITTP